MRKDIEQQGRDSRCSAWLSPTFNDKYTMKDQYNYVVARYWSKDDNRLCVYAYGNEVHYGTKAEANRMAELITERADSGEVYKPFFIHA